MKFDDKIICDRCKVAMKKIELKDVYKCPICNVIENRRLSK